MSDEERRHSCGRRADDEAGEQAREHESNKFVVLAWGLIVVIGVLFCALAGMGLVVQHLRSTQKNTTHALKVALANQRKTDVALAETRKNTEALNAGTCVIVATLDNGAASVRASLRHPVAPLPADRVEQLKASLKFQVGLANSLRRRVSCPKPPPSTKVPLNPKAKSG